MNEGNDYRVTKDEIYERYLKWSEGKPEILKEDLFRRPVVNRDVFENEVLVVNHLYFLFLKFDGRKTRHFIFYEANTFWKDPKGDLELAYSTYQVTANE